MPTKHIMRKIVTENPVLQSDYYTLCTEVLMAELFGWDLKKKRPLSRPGIFGHCESLFFATELQGMSVVNTYKAWIDVVTIESSP